MTAAAGRRDGVDPALRVRARPIADVLERDGEALVLLGGGGLVRLTAVGAAIVELAANPIRLDTLAGALERRFGSPGAGATLALTAGLVSELAGQGVLDVGDPTPPDGGGPFWRISDETAFTWDSAGQAVVFSLARPELQPTALLGTGTAIWHQLAGPDDHPRPWVYHADLVARLADAYGADPTQVATDVDDFLTRMAADGYLDRAAPPDPGSQR